MSGAELKAFPYMKIIDSKIKLSKIEKMAEKIFGNMVKGVIDIEKKILALEAELHIDEEQLLIEQGSKQKDLWGINLYPEFFGQDGFIEFDSMINLKPSQNNRSRGVENKEIQDKIVKIIYQLIEQ